MQLVAEKMGEIEKLANLLTASTAQVQQHVVRAAALHASFSHFFH